MKPITNTERFECYDRAVVYAQEAVGEGDGYIHPNARIGSFSPFEWGKLANAMVSGWICARSQQLVEDRWQDQAFLTMGEEPEPAALGALAPLLPKLGDFIEHRSLSAKPIGEWSRDDILRFLWLATEMAVDSQTARDERPSPAFDDDLMSAC